MSLKKRIEELEKHRSSHPSCVILYENEAQYEEALQMVENDGCGDGPIVVIRDATDVLETE